MTEHNIRKASGTMKRVIVFRLGPGADLLRAVEQIAREEGIKAGVIVSGVASLSKARLRNVKSFPEEFPITDKNRIVLEKDGPIELLSMTGNIASRDSGEFVIHAHIVVSVGPEDGATYGGHLIEGNIVYSLAEIAIAELDGIQMRRLKDPETKAFELYP